MSIAIAARSKEPPLEPIPYSCQQIDAEDIAAVSNALKGDFLTQGPTGPAFEEAFAAHHNVAHAIAVSNATAALHIGCLALGVGPESHVWTSPISFVASANCAVMCGAKVDFVDIDPASRNMSIAALSEKLERAERNGTLPDVLIPVHFAGYACDLLEMRALADRYGFRILADASHATGASYRGEPVGSQYADATVFSFHAVKIITSGEGGMVVTQDDALAQRLRLLRSHGVTRDPALMSGKAQDPWAYEQIELGFNYRLTDLQAALGHTQLGRLDEWRNRRESLAARYDALLADGPFGLPARSRDRRSSWHLYAIELGAGLKIKRREIFDAMRAASIGVNVHYIPIHTQPFYAQRGFACGDFPAAEAYYARALTLPLFPAMAEGQQDRIVQTLLRLVR